jgi:hypothetical protein
MTGSTREESPFKKAFSKQVAARSSPRRTRVPAAQYLPALNPHLTKSRLNDAPRLCEMLRRNQSCGGIERNTVELVWAQGE